MKLRPSRLAWGLLLLALPVPAYCLDLESVFQGLALGLLAVLAAIGAAIGLLFATGKLLGQLSKPEPAGPAQQRAAKWRIRGLMLPASVIAWALLAWLTYDPEGSWYYPAVPFTGLLGLAAGLLLWWKQRPTAARALLTSLLAMVTLATVIYLSAARLNRKPPVPLGLVGNPVFKEIPSAPAPAGAIDTSEVYTYVDQMPGFRGTGVALKKLVNNNLHYPELARDNHISGVVQVTFTVRPAGGLTQIRITQSLSPACDQEALRVLHLLAPYFLPGSQNGQPVPVQLSLSFGFGPTAALPAP